MYTTLEHHEHDEKRSGMAVFSSTECDRMVTSDEATTLTPDSTNTTLLGLPLELRLHIFSYALLDSPTITIGTAELVGPHHEIIHRLYGSGRVPFPGIPQNHEPVIDTRYDAALLSVTNPAIIPLPAGGRHGYSRDEEMYTAHAALLMVNRQINGELTRHFRSARNKNTSLFIQLPHGLHVCRTLSPQLIRQTRSIHLAGAYTPTTFSPRHAACVGSPQHDIKYHANVIPDATAHLTDLVRSLFGPHPTHFISKFEMRVYYPGSDSYSTVWGDDSSPIVVALRNVYAGEIGIEVWRGREGTGVYLTVKKSAEPDSKKRVVSTVWRKLEEGRRGEPRVGSWVVDARWPEWEDGHTVSGGDTVSVEMAAVTETG